MPELAPVIGESAVERIWLKDDPKALNTDPVLAFFEKITATIATPISDTESEMSAFNPSCMDHTGAATFGRGVTEAACCNCDTKEGAAPGVDANGNTLTPKLLGTGSGTLTGETPIPGITPGHMAAIVATITTTIRASPMAMT